MTSNVCVTNWGGFSYIPLKKRQILINTHHGGGAYKKVGIDVYGDSYFFRKDMLITSKQTTKFISSSKKFTECMSKATLIDKNKFWEIGMPRNDQLINKENEFSSVREKLNLKENEHLVLFAPTYRKINDNYFKDSIAIDYGLDYKRVCDALQKRFGGKWKFAYRYHPSIVNKDKNLMNNDEVIDLTNYEDMQELLIASDVLINDFSSSLWDYILTGKPCFMFALDLDHYVNTTDVYTPVETWPVPKARNNDELIDSILNFDNENYLSEIKRHYKELGGCETGNASQLIGDYIYENCIK